MWAANSFIEGIPENQWYDYTQLSTIIGWSTFEYKLISIKYVSSILHVVVTLEGESNSATTSFTLPIATCWEALRYFNGALFFTGRAVVNTGATFARIQPLTNPFNGISYDYTLVNCGYGVVGGVSGAWPTTGTKRIGCFFTMPIM